MGTLNRLLLVGLCSCLFTACVSAPPAASPASGGLRTARPNILLILVDDLRPEIGAYGVERAVTPHIDRLAAEGVVFERAYTQQAVCAPSRAALLSGLRPDSTGIDDLETPLRSVMPRHVTLPQHFRRHGYTTIQLGKVYHHRNEDPQAWDSPDYFPISGWDEPGHGWKGRGYLDPASWREVESYAAAHPGDRSGRGPATEGPAVSDTAYPDGKIANRAIEQLGRLRDRPFFMAVGFNKPHLPFNAPRKYWDLYRPERISLPANRTRPDGTTQYSLSNFGELRAYTDIPEQGPVPDEKARDLIRGYLAATSYADAQIGRVLDELNRLGLADNTIVVLWGDHGFKLGEYAEWAKHTNFDVDTRIPLVVRAPGAAAAGRRSVGFVETVDIYPTLAELAGLPTPVHQGLSFASLLRDPTRAWKRAAFSQYPRGADIIGRGIRTERYHYVEWQKGADGEVVARELYDHSVDPGETRNVAEESGRAGAVQELSSALRAGWRAALPPGISTHRS